MKIPGCISLFAFALAACTSTDTGIEVAEPSEPGPTTTITVAITDPTATEPPAVLEPTPEFDYSYTLLEYRFDYELASCIHSSLGPGIFIRAYGLVRNDTNEILDEPILHTNVYADNILVDRQRWNSTASYGIEPGEVVTFAYSGGILPSEKEELPGNFTASCNTLDNVLRMGYAPQDLQFELSLLADPMPASFALARYSDVEIASIREGQSVWGATYDITVANTGARNAYVALHFLIYDEQDRLVEAGYITVSSLAEYTVAPGQTADAFISGNGAARTEFFLLANYDTRQD
jgi:hypothetical protein